MPRILKSGFALSFALASLSVLPIQAQFPNANPAYQTGFPVVLNGQHVSTGSVALGDVNGNDIADIVVGTNDGKVHAYDGFGTKLWEYDTGDMGIGGKAAIGDVDGDGNSEVVVGAGSTFTPAGSGGLYVISHLGGLQCSFQTLDANGNTRSEGVFSSPALADLDGNDGGLLEIAFGAWDRHVRALHHDCSILWDVNVYDTVWSSPAIGDVDGNGRHDVVIGVDSDDDEVPTRPQGGELYVFDGATGAVMNGFPVPIDEIFQSSPGLADISANGLIDIAIGTGRCWSDPACAPGPVKAMAGEFLNIWDNTGTYLPGWPVNVVGTYAFASPALADVDGDARFEVILNTVDPGDNTNGQLYALNEDGSPVPGWPVRPTLPTGQAAPNDQITLQTTASPIVADLTGDSSPEVVVSSNFDLVIFDSDGQQLSYSTIGEFNQGNDFLRLNTNGSVNSAPAAGDVDGDGDVELVLGGSTSGGTVGVIYVWDFPSTTPADEHWPMFRRSSDNNARVGAGLAFFSDGFESGDTTKW